jgi:hypothetical protein
MEFGGGYYNTKIFTTLHGPNKSNAFKNVSGNNDLFFLDYYQYGFKTPNDNTTIINFNISNFNRYGVAWKKDEIKFYINGILVKTYKKSGSDEPSNNIFTFDNNFNNDISGDEIWTFDDGPYYLILNQAFGGVFFEGIYYQDTSGIIGFNKKIINDLSNNGGVKKMKIKYIAVYDLADISSNIINYNGSSISIGNNSGYGKKGINSISIGNNSAKKFEVGNSIILNGTGNEINSFDRGFYVDPIRTYNNITNTHQGPYILQYDPNTKEIFYSNEIYLPVKFRNYKHSPEKIVNIDSSANLYVYGDIVYKGGLYKEY